MKQLFLLPWYYRYYCLCLCLHEWFSIIFPFLSNGCLKDSGWHRNTALAFVYLSNLLADRQVGAYHVFSSLGLWQNYLNQQIPVIVYLRQMVITYVFYVNSLCLLYKKCWHHLNNSLHNTFFYPPAGNMQLHRLQM